MAVFLLYFNSGTKVRHEVGESSRRGRSSLGDVTAQSRDQVWPSRERLGSRLSFADLLLKSVFFPKRNQNPSSFYARRPSFIKHITLLFLKV